MMTEVTNKMTIDQAYFEDLLADFAEENVLACQGILSVARVVFTRSVPTLAVTLQEDPPTLLVNPEFVRKELETEDDVRAVLLHEFLHVLLGHTKLFTGCDPATNLALDAVINHLVQRELGLAGGEFFRRYYRPVADDDPIWLLRPMAPGDILPAAGNLKGLLPVAGRRLQDGDKENEAVALHRIRLGLSRGRILAVVRPDDG